MDVVLVMMRGEVRYSEAQYSLMIVSGAYKVAVVVIFVHHSIVETAVVL